MPQPQSYLDVEVRPEAVNLIVGAFEVFPSIGQKYLAKYGISSSGAANIPASRPYIPLVSWLATFKSVLSEVGPNALFKVGAHIIRNPYLPPGLNEIEAGLRQLDIAYHQSHRKGGQPMFDPATKKMQEGIGHYRVERRGREKVIFVRCDTPYPCPLEHGIVSGVAIQIDPRAVVVHHEPTVCRLKGADTCSYLVTW